MEEFSNAKECFKAVCDNYERDLRAQTAKLDEEEAALKERLAELNKKKLNQDYVNFNARDDDLMEINAGGKVISARRSSLTRFKGSRLEALFSGRWDKVLQRDGRGRIFLDVHPAGFRAIVDYLNEVAISSEDSPPNPPSVSDRHEHILRHQLQLFGLYMTNMPESNIITKDTEADRLHDWLEEDGSDGEFNLLYRGSRDGMSAASFHSKCDNQGCTLTVIKTIDGFILGGYSNVPWMSPGSACYCAANEAFLFVLSGSDISSPYKMKLMNLNDAKSIRNDSAYGPVFGRSGPHDIFVSGSNKSNNLSWSFGETYEHGPPGKLFHGNIGTIINFTIKDIEVFRVSDASTHVATATRGVTQAVPQVEPVSRFSEDINTSLNAMQKYLAQAQSELICTEDNFKDEQKFVPTFACGTTKDIVVLNVSGTVMATKRSTLQFFKDSVLARQFDDSKWTEQGCNIMRVKDWTPEDVASWASHIEDIPADVGRILKENGIKGRELLALEKDGLMMLGITRTGTLCLLLKEIKELEKASQDNVTIIEHSPYCFGKILDYLRLKCLHSEGLAEEPALPSVCDSQKNRFEKVVKYYFPGDSAKFILG